MIIKTLTLNLLILLVVLRCSQNPVSSEQQWSNEIGSKISSVDFNLEYMQNIGSGAVSSPIIGIQFFINFTSNPNDFKFDLLKIYSSSSNYSWQIKLDSSKTYGNTIYSPTFVSDYLAMGFDMPFPLGNYTVVLYSNNNRYEINKSVYLRNNKELIGSITDNNNPILNIPFIKSVSSNSDSIYVTLINRDSLLLRSAQLCGKKNGKDKNFSLIALPPKPGYSEYNLVYLKPADIDTVYIKIFSKVIGEIDSDYLSNSHLIKLSSNKIITNFIWSVDTIPPQYKFRKPKLLPDSSDQTGGVFTRNLTQMK